jgi:D-beta-D-heptose 7-phosphate kinase/D-beta-D-heptose 1-phosphate adenosyltransferase
LNAILDGLGDTKVLVVGDPILDLYHFGQVTRISQEAPVPIFVEHSAETRSGGMWNVAANAKALGCAVEMSETDPVEQASRKHRYLVGSHQIFRIDQDVTHRPQRLSERLAAAMQWCDVAILSDYGKGTLSDEFCQEFITRMDTKFKHVVVDPRGGDWNKYAGASVIVPNEHEWAAHLAIRHGTQPVFPFTLIKMGSAGMMLKAGGLKTAPIWQSNTKARHVFDVTGAGDTVIATFAAAGACSRSVIQAAELANLAAGVVVEKVGTATCSREELQEAINRG